jgi:hypothetical protein
MASSYQGYYGDPTLDALFQGPSNIYNVPVPKNNYIGSYVPQKYMLPDCPGEMIYHRGNSALYQGDISSWHSAARGVDTKFLYPEGAPMGCYDNFRSFLIDPPRDVLAADRLDSDPDGVLNVRRGQSRDLRGDIPLGVTQQQNGCNYGGANCYTMDPNTAMVGWKPWNSKTVPFPIMQGTNTKNDFFLTNKPVRSFIY